ncbi:MAG: tetratricopeptide repeat protein [Pedobacter sp.]|nr:MAG: tetratricopeptide repeat protein [Pedobacter sp.]
MKLIKLIFCFSILLASCNKAKNDGVSKGEYIEEVIDSSKLRFNNSYSDGSRYLDSVYNGFSNVSKVDLVRKYEFKAYLLKNTFFNNELALINLDSAINLINDNSEKYSKELIKIYILKADVLVNQYNYDDAFKYLYLAKQLNERNKDLLQTANSNIQIAFLLYKQEKYLDAITYFKAAVSELKLVEKNPKENTFLEQQRHLNNIGLCYEKAGQLENAINAYKIAINYLDANRKRFVNDKEYIDMAKGIVLGNLGSSYYKMTDYKNAEQSYKQSLALNKKDEQDALLTQIKLGQLYITKNQLNDAQAILNSLKNFSEVRKSPYLPVELRYRELGYKFYDQAGNKVKAYEYFKSYHKLKDSIDLSSVNLSNRDINKEFVKLAHAHEIEVFKKQDEVKSVYLVLAIVFILLSVLCIFLILRDVRGSKKHIKKLTVLNAKISGHNELMEKTLEALEQSQEENSHMMQILAHDMRTPIAGVIGLTSLMLDEDDLNEEHREIISMINTSGADTLNFINDLLQVQYNKNNLIKEPVEMHTLLKYCITLLDSKAKEKKQQLTIKTFPIEINISREKIWRVMSNLISNAIKFSPHGSKIHIEMEEKPLSLLIKVKDNGIGIPENLAAKLFNMDADVQRQGTDGEKSFGLGLAISKQIIEAHNGSIWFESLPGFGTTFFVELPITES